MNKDTVINLGLAAIIVMICVKFVAIVASALFSSVDHNNSIEQPAIYSYVEEKTAVFCHKDTKITYEQAGSNLHIVQIIEGSDSALIIELESRDSALEFATSYLKYLRR